MLPRMSTAALTSSRPWAIEPNALRSLLGQVDAIASMVRAGLSPTQRAEARMAGKPTVAYDLAGDQATIDIVGALMPDVPWWAHWLEMGYCCTGDVTAAIQSATADPRVRSIQLRMDSPGGSTAGIASCAAAVRAARAAGKAVHVVCDGMLCSAAYWIAAHATTITVGATAIIGAIGTYCVLTDTTKADAAAGLTYVLVTSGGVKGQGADGAVTEGLKAEMQRLVDGITALFSADIAAGRGLPADTVATLADGSIHLGAAAVAKGLATSVGTVAPTTQPTTGTPTTTEAHMPITADQMADLLATHPTHAAAISAQVKAGADLPTITAAIAKADTKAKDDRITALESESAGLRADLAKANEKIDRLAKLGNGAVDPGANPGTDAPVTGAAAVDQAWAAMNATQRAGFMNDIENYRWHVARGGK